MFAAAVIALTLFAAVQADKLYSEDKSIQMKMWQAFKAKFNKAYGDMEEESHRFGIFVENLRLADHRNALEIRNGGSAVHGVTHLMDLSQVEFESGFLTSDPSLRPNNSEKVLDTTARTVNEAAGLVDWTGRFTTAVKDQGYCGSCWAFSATEQIESDAMRTLGVTYVLSPEQITQCATAAYGCNGGWTEVAFKYVHSAGGIETDAAYPYTSYNGVTGSCKADSSKYVIGVNTYYGINGESAMASYVQTTGPLSVCVDANNWNTYKGGIMSVCGTSVDHCVQAVGVDASSGGYWKVRNSWSTSWGESGFIRLAYGHNTCAITNDPTYVSVFKK